MTDDEFLINKIMNEYDASTAPLRTACAVYERSESWFRNNIRRFSEGFERFKQIQKEKQEAKDLRRQDMAFRNVCQIANGEVVHKKQRTYYDKDDNPTGSFREVVQPAKSLEANLKILERADRILGMALPNEKTINLNFMGDDEYTGIPSPSGTDAISPIGTDEPTCGLLGGEDGEAVGEDDDVSLGDA